MGIANSFVQGFDYAIPSTSDLPIDITKPICVADSGYMIKHPDVSDDHALNADPARLLEVPLLLIWIENNVHIIELMLQVSSAPLNL